MKRVLLWMAMDSNGALSSGSAEFTIADGCLKGREALKSLASDLGFGKTIHTARQTTCISAKTGEPAPVTSRN